MNSETTMKTVQDVQENLQNGQFDLAVNSAQEVLQDNPDDVFCLSIIAQSEFNSGQLAEAKSTLLKALGIHPKELNLNRNLGLLCNRQGDFKESVSAFLKGVESNREHPEILLDLLLLGISLEKINQDLATRVLAFVFHQSTQLKDAYLNPEEIPLIVEASKIANAIVRDTKYAAQKEAINELTLGFEPQEMKRLNDFLDSFHGIQAPKYADEMQRPSYHVFPDLEPITFYPKEGLSWTALLEENFTDIKSELLALYDANNQVKPYIDGVVTENQDLSGLVDSLEWSSIHLIQAGKYNNELLEKCPKTQEVLKQLPLPVLSGNAPEAFLSVLKPGAEIKPHFGLSNIKLTVHLGLEIPIDCSIRVGQDVQSWEEGKVLVFDDSFEHEAWNHSDQERKVFILEVWHPDLSQLERQGIQKIMELQDSVTQVSDSDSIDTIIKAIKEEV